MQIQTSLLQIRLFRATLFGPGLARVCPARSKPAALLLPNQGVAGTTKRAQFDPALQQIQSIVNPCCVGHLICIASSEKFILSVSIIADIEQCPETPPPVEPRTQQFADSAPQAGRQSEAQQLLYGTAVPTNV